jgi:hypothetical protein
MRMAQIRPHGKGRRYVRGLQNGFQVGFWVSFR